MSFRLRKLYQRIFKFFDNDLDKIEAWFTTPNPLFGDISPDEMVDIGRIDKMMDIVERQLGMNDLIGDKV